MLLPDTQHPSCRAGKSSPNTMARPRSGQCQRRKHSGLERMRSAQSSEAGEIAVGAANRLQMQAWEDFRIAQAQAKSTAAAESDAGRQAAAPHTNCAMANGQVNCTTN